MVKSGYSVIGTGNPDDVPRLLEDETPHLALLDLMLPGTDGFDLMKETMRSGAVPTILVSAYGQDQLVARSFEISEGAGQDA